MLPSPSSCWPNQATLSNTCARLTLLVDKVKLPQGTTVEGLCGDLRGLLANQQAIEGLQNHLVLLCDLKTDYNDTVEVTLVSNVLHHFTHTLQSLYCAFGFKNVVPDTISSFIVVYRVFATIL